MRAVALRILGDEFDAQECENDTYLGVWNTIPPKRPGDLRAYVIRIARYQALKRLDYYQARKSNSAVTLSFEELEDALAAEEGPEQEYEDEELAEAIRDFLVGLAPENRRIFLQRYWYYASIPEIMDECGMSRQQVESRLFRMRKRLKTFLTERGLR